MTKQVNKIVKISLVILGVLVVISSMFSSGMLAKFMNNSNNDDTARVATFNVDMTSAQTTIPLTISSDPISFDIVIVNYDENNVTEVASEYQFEVVTLGNLPLKITISQKSFDGNGTIGTINNLTVTGGFMKATEKTQHAFTITVQWDTSAPNYKDAKYAEEIDLLKVKFIGSQVD